MGSSETGRIEAFSDGVFAIAITLLVLDVFYNGLLLFGVTIVPFPTALVAEYLRHDGQRTAAAVYNGTFILIAICYNLLWRRAAVSGRLLHAHASRHAVQRIFDSYRYGPLWYLTAFMLAFVSVPASLVVDLVLAVVFARPTAAAKSSNPPVVVT